MLEDRRVSDQYVAVWKIRANSDDVHLANKSDNVSLNDCRDKVVRPSVAD
jgi:hypothetical protein